MKENLEPAGGKERNLKRKENMTHKHPPLKEEREREREREREKDGRPRT